MRSKLQGVCSAESRTVISLVPSRLMMRASPGCSSFIGRDGVEGGLDHGALRRGDDDFVVFVPEARADAVGVLGDEGSPVPTMPPITYRRPN